MCRFSSNYCELDSTVNQGILVASRLNTSQGMTQLTHLIQFPLVNSQIQADDVTVTKLNRPTVPLASELEMTKFLELNNVIQHFNK